MTAYIASKAEEKPPAGEWSFGFPGSRKTYKMPAQDAVIPIDETIRLAMLPAAQQQSEMLRAFLTAMPEEARTQIKSRSQIADLFQAWTKHGSGVSLGE